MATEVVKVFVLYCGQAMTNWIEYYDDETKVGKEDTPPTATALFDLGKSNTHVADSSALGLHWLLKRIKGYYSDPEKSKHIIDFVAFSHADGDHWDMIGDFLKQADKFKPELKISKIVRCGWDWEGDAADAVNELNSKLRDEDDKFPIILEYYRSDYRWGTHLFEKNGCTFKAMIANTVLKKNVNQKYPLKTVVGDRMNDSSLMMAIELGGRSVILPGDGTWITMEEASKLYGETSHPAPCYALALPHHGALATALRPKTIASTEKEAEAGDSDTPGTKESTKDWSVLKTFRDHINPKCIVASANRKNTYCHPRLELFEFFETKTNDEEMEKDLPHKIIAYDATGVFAHPRSIASRTTAGADNKTPDVGSTAPVVDEPAPTKRKRKKTTVSAKRTPTLGKRKELDEYEDESEDEPNDSDDEDFNPNRRYGPPKKRRRTTKRSVSGELPRDIEHYHIEYALFSEKTRPPTMTVWKPAPLGGGADVAIFTMVGPDPAVPGGAAGGGDDVGG